MCERLRSCLSTLNPIIICRRFIFARVMLSSWLVIGHGL